MTPEPAPIVDRAEPTAGPDSVWRATMPGDEIVRTEPLTGDADADVVIVGGGYTGLWTAWHLLRRDPALRVVVLERETIGFGASGRNGGWCSALLPMSLPALAARHGDAAATRMQRAMHANVADVVAFAAAHGMGDSCVQGGTVTMARTRPQAERLRADLAVDRRFGFGDEDRQWLSPAEASAMCNATDVLGGAFTPHCATVHPLRLVHAVARAALAAGVRIHERTAVTEIGERRVTTARGTVRAEVVVRATEGYTSSFAGLRRALLPIYSLMIATDRLDSATWDRIGLTDRPTFHDARWLVVYGQRTPDGRIAFGGRGAPYHFGSAVRPEFDTDERVREHLAAALRELFPVLADVPITHHWGGVLAAPRDWTCFVRFDRRSGSGTAGGYVGDGVGTAHLAGRTLAALITASTDDADREVVRLPWVGHRSRPWEPEPLRWIGVNGTRVATARADAVEERTGRRSRLWGGVVERVLGH